MPVGANPRSFALDAAGRLLVVGTRGGVEVFAVTANGGLSVAARAGGWAGGVRLRACAFLRPFSPEGVAAGARARCLLALGLCWLP